MLMNKAETWLVNNTVRRMSMRFEAKKLRKMSPALQPKTVLEIGCGEGQGAKNILRYWQPSSIYSIDLDPKMVARAKTRLKDSRVKFAVHDAADLSFAKNNTYDAIFDFGIIHHIPNWQDCLRELYRVLKPGGFLHIEDLAIGSFTKTGLGRFLKRVLDHPYDQMYSRAAFDKELSRLGFKTVGSSEIGKLDVFWRVLTK